MFRGSLRRFRLIAFCPAQRQKRHLPVWLTAHGFNGINLASFKY